MSKAKITLLGMYKWMSDNNDDLFYNLSTPTGIDKQLLINTILMNGAEFEVLYSDPEFMKFLIGVWSDKWQRTMEKWINVLSIVYNPLENYDRMEDWEDLSNKINQSQTTASHSDNDTHIETNAKSENAIADDYSVSSGTGSTTNTVSAYDSGDWENHDKADSSSSGENLSSGLTSATGNTSMMSADSNAGNSSDMNTDIGSENAKRSGRAHGNIGVTTSQQMLEAELDISKFNLYDEISNLFLTEFVIYTY